MRGRRDFQRSAQGRSHEPSLAVRPEGCRRDLGGRGGGGSQGVGAGGGRESGPGEEMRATGMQPRVHVERVRGGGAGGGGGGGFVLEEADGAHDLFAQAECLPPAEALL